MRKNSVSRFLVFVLLLVTTYMCCMGQKKAKNKANEKGKQKTEIKVFVKTFVSKSMLNSSDTLLLTYRLYTTRELSDMSTDGQSFLRDFRITDITSRRTEYTEEKIKGVTYKVIDLQKLILQPRSEGVRTIFQRTFYLQYDIPTGETVRDFWGDEYQKVFTERIEAKGDEVKIHVINYIEV